MNYIESIGEFIKTFEFWQHALCVVCGLIFGFLINILAVKLRLWRLEQKRGDGNTVTIEMQNRRSKAKRDESSYYFECINKAQWQGTNSNSLGINRID